MDNEDVNSIQRLYPQIYIACHIDHVRAVSTKWRISSQDASILVHLDHKIGLSSRALAKHLGVVPSTLSAAISRLAKLGYLNSEPDESDRRKREIRLTPRGAQAIAATSVLDANRVQAMLNLLNREERKEAVHGLSLLARAARQLSIKEKQ
jgi:DNA-binding MarR family transcriptional regulator